MLKRPRRNRKSQAIRNLVADNHLLPQNLVQPFFLVDGQQQHLPIPSLPGSARMSIDVVLKQIEACLKVGVQTFMGFPVVPEHLKDKMATYSYANDNFYLHGARKIKETFPEACLISDVAMDPYSSDGHDGLVDEDGQILNDATLPILEEMAIAQAQAGFDIIGPSDMMDGRVLHIREALDDHDYTDVSIMSYTAKYASAFYGPFRDALDSAPKAGDKKTYQMNPANRRAALIEAELDEAEGADFLMVKPAIHYMDVIKALKEDFDLPIAAYYVSGESAMLLAACQNGWLDFEKAMPEALLCLKRAGADVIITYFAQQYGEWYGKRMV